MLVKSPWIALILVTVLLLVPLPVIPLAHNWDNLAHVIENTAHPVAFCWLTMRLLRIRRAGVRGESYLLAVSLAMALALATEYVQSTVGRDASWEDVRNDIIGTLLALALQARRDLSASSQSSWRALATTCAALLLLLAILPLASTIASYTWRWEAFPVLWESDSFFAKRLSHWKTDEYPGFVLDEPAENWSGYSTLQVKVRSLTQSGTELRIRVHDRRHNQEIGDRYNATFTLLDGEQRVVNISLDTIRRAPLTREMDLSAIRGIIIFQDGGPGSPHFDVSEIRLVR